MAAMVSTPDQPAVPPRPPGRGQEPPAGPPPRLVSTAISTVVGAATGAGGGTGGTGGTGDGPRGGTGRRPAVLVVDDDRTIRDSLRRSLHFNGFAVETAVDGADALAQIGRAHPDVVVLDVMMPRVDGLATCRILRASGDDVPVLALTARDAVADRVAGLDAGADDYLVKPFALAELLARLRALLRRVPAPPRDGAADRPGGVLSHGGLTLDPRTRDVTRTALRPATGAPAEPTGAEQAGARNGSTGGGTNGETDRAVRLTRTEFALLEMFLRNPQVVLTRERILEEVWGFDFPTTANSLEVYVGYLRRKTEAGGEPRLIHTVRGIGYVLRETPP